MDVWKSLEDGFCYFCGDSCNHSSGICSKCRCRTESESSKKGLLCPRCSQPLFIDGMCSFCRTVPDGLSQLFSISYFSGTMKEIVTLYKSGKQLNFRYYLAELLFDSIVKMGWQDFPVIPIPPRKGKVHRTGWDQVDLLCGILKRKYRMNIISALKRNDRIQQKTLHFSDREKHMIKSLTLSDSRIIRESLSGHKVLVLLDDVYTSGATLSAAADLAGGGFEGDIVAIVLCSVI